MGANKQFLEQKLPHIASVLVPSLPAVVACSKTLIVCKNHADYKGLAGLVKPGQAVIDLVGALKTASFPPGCYHGLYW